MTSWPAASTRPRPLRPTRPRVSLRSMAGARHSPNQPTRTNPIVTRRRHTRGSGSSPAGRPRVMTLRIPLALAIALAISLSPAAFTQEKKDEKPAAKTEEKKEAKPAEKKDEKPAEKKEEK